METYLLHNCTMKYYKLNYDRQKEYHNFKHLQRQLGSVKAELRM